MSVQVQFEIGAKKIFCVRNKSHRSKFFKPSAVFQMAGKNLKLCVKAIAITCFKDFLLQLPFWCCEAAIELLIWSQIFLICTHQLQFIFYPKKKNYNLLLKYFADELHYLMQGHGNARPWLVK